VTILPEFRHAEVSAILKHTEAVGIAIPREFRRFDYFKMIQEVQSVTPSLRHVLLIGDDVPDGAISVKEMCNRELEQKYPSDYLQKRRFNVFEALQIATSTGTTGMPKCIEFISCVRQYTGRVVAKRLKLTRADIVGAFAPAISGGCYNEVYRSAPIVGASIALAKYFTPETIFELIEKERVTAAAMVPTVLIRLLDDPSIGKYDLSSLRLVKHGGSFLPYGQALNAWKKFGCPVLPAYGTLDIGTIGTSFVDSPQGTLLRSMYTPLDGVEIKLVDEKNREVPRGEIGELLVRGLNCQPGYYNDPQAIAEFYKDGWFQTGDLASFNEEGRFVIRGRRKDVIIRGGHNIYPFEIEGMLLKHPKVSKAAVVGMSDPEMLEKACVFVVLKAEEELGFLEMKIFLRNQGIAPFKIPERLEIIHSLPLVGGIKVDKKRLRQGIETKLKQEMDQDGCKNNCVRT
jgi:non-ribosomal peptide synthetase component E (peptide arylation enzyme)